MRKLLLLLLITCLPAFLLAQQPHFRKIAVTPKIDDIHLLKIQQDEAGYLWLGTNKGVYKYNGSQITAAQGAKEINATAISFLKIFNHQLLAGTSSGQLQIIDIRSNIIQNSIQVCEDEITAITIDSKGRIWIGTANTGIYIGNIDKPWKRLNTESNLPDDVIHCFATIQNQTLAGTDRGLIRWKDNQNESSFELFNQSNGLTDDLITTLTPSREANKIILGNQNGSISEWDLNNNSNTPYSAINNSPKGSIIKIVQTNNQIFCFTDDHQVFIGKNARDNFAQSSENEFSPFTSKTPFSDALYDMEGNLIACNGTHELLISDSRFLFITDHDGESLGKIRSIISDSNSNLWFASPNGVYSHQLLFSNEQLLVKHLPKPKDPTHEIISLSEDHLGNIWFGMYGAGLGFMDTKTKRTKIFTEKNGLVNNNVLSISPTNQGLWLATLGGACYVNLEGESPSFQRNDQIDKISNYIYTVFTDSKNRVWFGTDGQGPIILENGKIRLLGKEFPYIAKNILDVAEDAQGAIWFLTSDQQVQCFKGNRIEKREIINEGAQPDLLAIETDKEGNVLVLTSTGFAVLRSDNPRIQFLAFEDEVTSNYLNISCKDEEGNIWMGLENALIRFRANQGLGIIRPKPRIEEILVLLEKQDTSIHEYASNQNHFTFRFSSIWLQQQQKVKYRYKLIGFDENWFETRDLEASFPKLPAGSYTFVLQASTGNDWFDADQVSYSFEICRPYWQQWWAIALFIIGFTTTIFLLLRSRDKKLKEKSIIERERIQSQFETLRNQINPHFLFNSFNTLISTISKDQEMAIDYVQQLSDYFRTILEQRDKETITLAEELELVKRYFFLQKQRFGDNLKVEISIDKKLEDYIIPPLTLQLLVENAIKHNIIAKAKNLHVSILSDENVLVIKNNLQEKSQKEPSTGVGLSNIINRYRILFNKEIEIIKTENEFIVHLPLIRNQK
jgi:ligand-binding sensor domain-containing protein